MESIGVPFQALLSSAVRKLYYADLGRALCRQLESIRVVSSRYLRILITSRDIIMLYRLVRNAMKTRRNGIANVHANLAHSTIIK